MEISIFFISPPLKVGLFVPERDWRFFDFRSLLNDECAFFERAEKYSFRHAIRRAVSVVIGKRLVSRMTKN